MALNRANSDIYCLLLVSTSRTRILLVKFVESATGINIIPDQPGLYYRCNMTRSLVRARQTLHLNLKKIDISVNPIIKDTSSNRSTGSLCG